MPKELTEGNRWIAISVEMFDHPVVGAHLPAPKPVDPKRASWQPMVAWQWMLTRAAWRAHTPMVKGHPVKLLRGQLVCSSRFLADNANWSHKTARVFLDRLARFSMISLSTATREGQLALDFTSPEKGTAKGTATAIVTICNYDRYQLKLHSKGHSQGHSKGTARAQGSTNNKNTNSNDGKESYQSRKESKDRKIGFSNFDPSDRTDGVVSAKLPFARTTIDSIVAMGCDLEKLLKAYDKRAGRGRIKDPSAYLMKMACEDRAKAQGITVAQVRGMLSRNRDVRVATAVNVVGAFSGPSQKVLERAHRRNPVSVERALDRLKGKTYASQEAADRAFEAELVVVRWSHAS